MKLKCPGCSKTLQIPESAAGKTVKCPCGQALRVPGPAAATGRPAATPRPGATPRPAPRPAVAANPLDGLMDELTDSDLKPVAAVRTAGVAVKAAAGHGKTGMYLSEVDTSGGKVKGGPVPIVLYVIAVLCSGLLVWNAWELFGTVKSLLAIESFKPGEESIRMGWFFSIFRLAIYTIGFLVAIANCFVRKPSAWFLGLFWAAFIVTMTFYPLSQFSECSTSIKIGMIAQLIIGIATIAMLYLKAPRVFYQSTDSPIFKPILANVLGVVAGLVMTAVPFFL